MSRVDTGRTFEERAASFLAERGVKILERNFRCRQGEVDIIGIHEGCLVFVEVKYRKSDRAGMPEEAVGVQKQSKICKTSDYFRVGHRQYASCQVRYDVVAILGDEIRWYQNAFPYHQGKTSAGW